MGPSRYGLTNRLHVYAEVSYRSSLSTNHFRYPPVEHRSKVENLQMYWNVEGPAVAVNVNDSMITGLCLEVLGSRVLSDKRLYRMYIIR